MTSLAPSPVPVAVYVTGFGPFADVQTNPSATMARRVAAALRVRMQQPHPDDRVVVTAVEVVEMETSLQATAAYFAALAEQLDALLRRDAHVRVLLFHMGLHSGERGGVMRVELRGYNELHASVPDARGVHFDHHVIEPGDGDAGVFLDSVFGQATSPALPRLTAFVAAHADDARRSREDKVSINTAAETNTGKLRMPIFLSPRWALSHNAGRYLCNCALYNALRLQQHHRGRVAAVFVHVVDPAKRAVVDAGDGDDTAAGVAASRTDDTHGHSSSSNNNNNNKKHASDGDGGGGGDVLDGVARDVYNPTLLSQVTATMQLLHELLDAMADMHE